MRRKLALLLALVLLASAVAPVTAMAAMDVTELTLAALDAFEPYTGISPEKPYIAGFVPQINGWYSWFFYDLLERVKNYGDQAEYDYAKSLVDTLDQRLSAFMSLYEAAGKYYRDGDIPGALDDAYRDCKEEALSIKWKSTVESAYARIVSCVRVIMQDELSPFSESGYSEKVREMSKKAISEIAEIDPAQLWNCFDSKMKSIQDQINLESTPEYLAGHKSEKIKLLTEFAGADDDDCPASVRSYVAGWADKISSAATVIEADHLYATARDGVPPEKLKAAKELAVARLEACAGGSPSSAVQAIVSEYSGKITEIAYDEAVEFDTLISAVSDITSAGETAIRAQLAAEELAAAKPAAVSKLTEAAGASPSDELLAIVSKYTALINDAASVADVIALLADGTAEIQNQQKKEADGKELADAKAEAVKALEAQAGENRSAALQEILDKNIRLINDAASVSEVEQVLSEARAAIEEQKRAESLTKGIKLNKSKKTLYAKKDSKNRETLQLKATVDAPDPDRVELEWTSGNPKIAKVDKNGKVTALKAGKTVITVMAMDGSNQSAQCTVTVRKDSKSKLRSISFNKSALKLKVGEKFTLTVKTQPSSVYNNKVKWTTSDKKIATVSNGVVTARKAGKCTITATATDGSGKKKTIKITVTKK